MTLGLLIDLLEVPSMDMECTTWCHLGNRRPIGLPSYQLAVFLTLFECGWCDGPTVKKGFANWAENGGASKKRPDYERHGRRGTGAPGRSAIHKGLPATRRANSGPLLQFMRDGVNSSDVTNYGMLSAEHLHPTPTSPHFSLGRLTSLHPIALQPCAQKH